jgi:hypothetical protein
MGEGGACSIQDPSSHYRKRPGSLNPLKLRISIYVFKLLLVFKPGAADFVIPINLAKGMLDVIDASSKYPRSNVGEKENEEEGEIDNISDFIKKALGNPNCLPHEIRADFVSVFGGSSLRFPN